MRWEEAYEGWHVKRLSQEEAARLLGVCPFAGEHRTAATSAHGRKEKAKNIALARRKTPVMLGSGQDDRERLTR